MSSLNEARMSLSSSELVGSNHVIFSCGAGRNLSSSRSAPNAPKIRTNLPLDIRILKPLDFLYSQKRSVSFSSVPLRFIDRRRHPFLQPTSNKVIPHQGRSSKCLAGLPVASSVVSRRAPVLRQPKTAF
jgi:hypothetical protein